MFRQLATRAQRGVAPLSTAWGSASAVRVAGAPLGFMQQRELSSRATTPAALTARPAPTGPGLLLSRAQLASGAGALRYYSSAPPSGDIDRSGSSDTHIFDRPLFRMGLLGNMTPRRAVNISLASTIVYLIAKGFYRITGAYLNFTVLDLGELGFYAGGIVTTAFFVGTWSLTRRWFGPVSFDPAVSHVLSQLSKDTTFNEKMQEAALLLQEARDEASIPSSHGVSISETDLELQSLWTSNPVGRMLSKLSPANIAQYLPVFNAPTMANRNTIIVPGAFQAQRITGGGAVIGNRFVIGNRPSTVLESGVGWTGNFVRIEPRSLQVVVPITLSSRLIAKRRRSQMYPVAVLSFEVVKSRRAPNLFSFRSICVDIDLTKERLIYQGPPEAVVRDRLNGKEMPGPFL
ncbi:hypothetical protein H696_01939 [Fonticula alba]|uniref:Uncharacterized protein n=1 Tax=Fonticula alba TaxID=691883 RepID=A0A058ZAP5_FONAL|nr:hypothetical protein H696_01939 [Fonticula alba]KCV70993.1 hypothetical protein H696_01939 [Fonticula alba]|eukprot:XP_009494116.1 hypothetical protein H696_01939 [Fonticula alba]